MDLITLAMGLSQFVPSVAKWLTGSGQAEAVAQKAVDIALAVTGQPTGAAALQALHADPALASQYRQAVLDQAVAFERLAVKNAADINATMRAEAAAEHWPSYSWRPAIGFAVAFAILACAVTVVGAYAAAMITGNTQPLEFLPGMLAAMGAVIGVAAPILGIASWFRGKMQADPAIPTINKG